MKKVVIIGGGFAGLNAAKKLGNKDIQVTLIDRRNHHLFQPLLYQVAMAGLSPSDIATPIRSLLSKYKNITVLQGNAEKIDAENNPLKNAPHTVEDLIGDWDRPYSREQACYPPGAFRVDKYWSPVNRVDNAYGDRNLVCSCPSMESYK